jgi:ketosteroid isomerase-like protein
LQKSERPGRHAYAGYLEAVSRSNVELVRSVLRAFEKLDTAAIEELCAPDAEYDWSRRLLDPVVVRGFDGLRAFFDEVHGIFDEIVFKEEEVLEFGDELLVVSTGRFRGRTSGVDVTARAANVWTIRDGKLARFRFYQTKEDALEDLASEGAALSAPPETEAG